MNLSKTADLEIQSDLLSKASFVFEAVLNPVCRRLLRLLDEEERLTVNALCRMLELEQAVCCNYLSILCRADLVLTETDCGQVFYAVDYSKLDQLHACAEAISI